MKDLKNMVNHLKSHQTFPASKDELVKKCNELSDFSDEDKRWFENNLPEGNYRSAEDVVEALGVKGQAMQYM